MDTFLNFKLDKMVNSKFQQMFLAKALYDNVAETPDELAFRRGDVITVVEQDPGGLEGWWLCNLRDRQGIAPGNRLKILSGMIDKEKDNIYSSPKSSPRNSWDALKSSPEENISNRSMQDYDVPRTKNRLKDTPSRGSDTYDSPSAHNRSSSDASFQDYSNQSFYDTPTSNRPVGYSLNNSAFDIPTPEKGNKDVNNFPSNRSSTLSTASNDSSATLSSCASNSSYHRSSIPSTCDSARSSLDVSSNDFYDIPRDLRTIKQVSTDSGLDLYDSPQKPKPVSQSSFIEDYDVPKSGTLKANKSNTSRRGSLEHALDDIYDVPKNNAPRVLLSTNSGSLSFSRAVSDPVSPMNVYDVPPQVTRDSIISARSDSSEEGQRLSTCSTDSRLSDIPNYDELLLDLDSALERLVKVQQDVTKSINKLLSFISSTWRKKESLETKLYEIKVACTNVKKSLSEFVQFAEGALGNSTKLSDKKLVNKLYKQLNPLQNSLLMITTSMLSLEEDKWQVALLSEPLDSGKSDHLGQIATVSKDLTIDVRKLASFIQGNSTLLFKRAYEVDFKKFDSKSSFDESGMYSKPPIGPKGENGTKTYTPRKMSGNLQQRPLPPPPPLDRPLPLTPVEQRLKSASMNSINLKDRDYQNQSLAEDIYSNEEYDYVQLETNDAAAHKKIKEEMDKKMSSSTPELTGKSKSASLESLDDELYETLKLSTPEPVDKNLTPVLPQKSSLKTETSIELPKAEPAPQIKTNAIEIKKPVQSLSQQKETEELKVEENTPDVIAMEQTEESSNQNLPDIKEKGSPPATLPKPAKKQIEEDMSTTEGENNSFLDKLNKFQNNDIVKSDPTDEESVVSRDDAPENLAPPASTDLSSSAVDLSQLDISNFIDDDLKTPVNKDLNFILPEVKLDLEETFTLDANDKQVLVYYGEQMNTHTTLLSNAIDAFLNCIENSEPPKIFISNSKFVVLSAHKLVYMGDTLHKNLIHSQVRNRVMQCANHLCDVLKQSVVATKTAALQYPSVAAVQEMVDRIMDVSHAANNMKVVISQSAAL